MGYTLLIDNYDSFTWNIYADISTLGGNPLVKRNDQITIQDIETMFTTGDLDRIIISPGPGHPRTDSGISREVITWGTGKLPILGVCMGLECLVDVMGGEIAYAGEIKHGKTSIVTHDNMGIFHNLPAGLSSTRYHSLSASMLTLPKLLQVTATTSESGVIMGVRHRENTVEAVQYHPESVMSEGGRGLLANFLKLKGGHWGGENAWCGVVLGEEIESSPTKQPTLPTILNQIHAQRLLDVSNSQSNPSTTPANLRSSLALHTSPPLISFLDRIKSTPHTAIMAEIKRASPSKGDIAPLASAPSQGLKYALAGASVISVLTEPKWFKGSLTDLLAVRMAVDSLPNRPAILRKDFILSTYQIDEARLYGADTVLLIVAMLDKALLQELYTYSKKLGMEPLVEVNNPAELEIALEIGSRVIGVNNRNLHDFNVDMSTTTRVNQALASRNDIILCALSGISSRKDVETYVNDGVRAVLVGESLMRAEDTTSFLRELIGLSPIQPVERKKTLVKICGIRSKSDAEMVIKAGADLVGIILVPGAKRRVSFEVGREISDTVHAYRRRHLQLDQIKSKTSDSPETWFNHHHDRLLSRPKPLLVGVFQNQPLSEIQSTIDALDLDIVQLHGDEPQSWAKFISVPTIKVFRVDSGGKISGGEIGREGYNHYILLDAAPSSGGAGGGGGEGKSFPWEHAQKIVERGLPVILAGGLNPENVALAVESVGGRMGGLICVDVSSGVEAAEGGMKDGDKVQKFIQAVKG